MLIVCPACASAYEIDAERVGASGRSVRCAACRETWFITPDDVTAAKPAPDFEALAINTFTAAGNAGPAFAEPVQDEPESVIDQPIPQRRRPAQAKQPGRFALPSFRAFSPALAIGIVVFALLPLSLLGRGAVVRVIPQSAGLFAAIGLPVNLRGVDFRDVAAFQNQAEGDKPAELIVEGDLVGISRARVDLAELVIEVRDDHGAMVRSWTVAAPRPSLDSGETARFRASLSSPPERGRDVRVRFAEAKAEVKSTHPADDTAGPAPVSNAAEGHDVHAH